MTDTRIDSGIETAMMIVARQLPRNSRIISPVRHAAISASRMTPCTEARTNTAWSASGFITKFDGTVRATLGSSARMPLTTESVDAVPDFRITTSTARWPSWRTMLVCGIEPSATVATSRR